MKDFKSEVRYKYISDRQFFKISFLCYPVAAFLMYFAGAAGQRHVNPLLWATEVREGILFQIFVLYPVIVGTFFIMHYICLFYEWIKFKNNL